MHIECLRKKGQYQAVALNSFLSFAERSSILLWLCIFQTSSRQIVKKRLFPEGNFNSFRKMLMQKLIIFQWSQRNRKNILLS